ncbi:uncharacterized protein MELLADRAFT_111234 [Melampsora larici-populina 98AG31]|uniref:Ubiquinol-cytochrome c chaperone domain-containing protein n=1 Tax=Melampsora larici-populina (strain 98AG31 / pathotype 3-4-7) TaxID=747676 RepID=F4S2H0_MELLP|nr:uncharacterized protein MELLADRAFT_111234 [Melampsora larici-populina 98AG31]EGG01176.1 hypothetical protein MELLADRAFT_111234 [Melampsora larici-populina 98AG31]
MTHQLNKLRLRLHSSNFTSFYHPSHQLVLNRFSTKPTTTTTTKTTAYHIGKSGQLYSPWFVKLVTTLGNRLGYNLPTSHAITITSDLYDHCSNQFQLEKSFWINECGLPDSFQTWFQITQLHMWILIVRFRSMKNNLGRTYIQEFVNHGFLDTEHRIRSTPYKVTKNSLIKSYMKTMLDQHYGFLVGFDWALATDQDGSDSVLVEAVWRNLFGARWGKGMGGVKGKFNSNPLKESEEVGNRDGIDGLDFLDDVLFLDRLERILVWIRIELIRVSRISDDEIINYSNNKLGDLRVRNKLIEFGKF